MPAPDQTTPAQHPSNTRTTPKQHFLAPPQAKQTTFKQHRNGTRTAHTHTAHKQHQSNTS
eukprot:3414580-Lingulodinium_polyedra.AAC.1